jgi:hypothetical protein
MTTYALLVGVERYDQPDWPPLEGPCKNALDVADWLLDAGTDPANITMFLALASTALEPRIAALERRGVIVERDAAERDIDDYCRSRLQVGRDPHSTLLVYWSGHGVTNLNQQRIFFCRDYRADIRNNRVVNCTDLLTRLHGETFACFPRQVLLADVCGVYSTVPVPQGVEPAVMPRADQSVFFATPEGDYATSVYGSGEFTTFIVGVLRGLVDWHTDLDGLEQAVTAAVPRHRGRPFLLSTRSRRGALDGLRVGAHTPDDGSDPSQSVMELLVPLKIPPAELTPLYLATVAALGEPALEDALGLAGIVKELSSLRSLYGLYQLLARLARRDAVNEADDRKDAREQAIKAWLDAAPRQDVVSKARADVDLELRQRILCIEVHLDETAGVINAYTPHLARHNYVLDPSWTPGKVAVRGWDGLEASLHELFEPFMVRGSLSNVDVQFVVDPPLIDHPFHKLTVKPDGETIGDQTIVLVRERARVRGFDWKARKRWQACAEAVRTRPIEEVRWVKIRSDVEEFPAELALCFARFPLPQRTDARDCPAGKKTITRLLKRGAPYLYLPQSELEEADWEHVERELASWLGQAKSLDGVPNHVLNRRMDGSKYAREAVIVWDDPLLNPFPPAEGIREA